MLSAPDPIPQDQAVLVSQKHPPVEQYLRGLPASDKANFFLHCRGAMHYEDSACFATLVKGGRCSRNRMTGSNFCKQHSHEVMKQERQAACWEIMEGSFQDRVSGLCAELLPS